MISFDLLHDLCEILGNSTVDSPYISSRARACSPNHIQQTHCWKARAEVVWCIGIQTDISCYRPIPWVTAVQRTESPGTTVKAKVKPMVFCKNKPPPLYTMGQ